MAFITLNTQNFYHNLNQIALKTGSINKISVVLKDNAYGHGLEEVAQMANSFGIKNAVVRTTIEANQIKHLFDHILILGDNIEVQKSYSYVINQLSDIKTSPKGAKVELKVDTGMHRNGVSLDEVQEALNQIEKKELNLVGFMTHYRSADVLSSEFFWQQKNFEKAKKILKKFDFKNVCIHSFNSASILRTKTFNEDLVRVGIGIYGHNELPMVFDEVKLKPVLSLFANKISSRLLKKGERVGYGGDFIASKDMNVSTYDIGYGDGWFRAEYLNRPFITAENLPILGRVSMDFIVLESTKDTICIIDDAKEASAQLSTISYEVTTALSKDIVKKIII